MMIGSQNVCFTLVDITVNMFYFSINKWRFSFALKYVGSWKPLEVIIFIVKHPLVKSETSVSYVKIAVLLESK